jgi:hypothetical protein
VSRTPPTTQGPEHERGKSEARTVEIGQLAQMILARSSGGSHHFVGIAFRPIVNVFNNAPSSGPTVVTSSPASPTSPTSPPATMPTPDPTPTPTVRRTGKLVLSDTHSANLDSKAPHLGVMPRRLRPRQQARREADEQARREADERVRQQPEDQTRRRTGRPLRALVWFWVLLVLLVAAAVIGYVLWGGSAGGMPSRGQISGTLLAAALIVPGALIWGVRHRRRAVAETSTRAEVDAAADWIKLEAPREPGTVMVRRYGAKG